MASSWFWCSISSWMATKKYHFFFVHVQFPTRIWNTYSNLRLLETNWDDETKSLCGNCDFHSFEKQVWLSCFLAFSSCISGTIHPKMSWSEPLHHSTLYVDFSSWLYRLSAVSVKNKKEHGIGGAALLLQIGNHRRWTEGCNILVILKHFMNKPCWILLARPFCDDWSPVCQMIRSHISTSARKSYHFFDNNRYHNNHLSE